MVENVAIFFKIRPSPTKMLGIRHEKNPLKIRN